jgi:hypothetical protein
MPLCEIPCRANNLHEGFLAFWPRLCPMASAMAWQVAPGGDSRLELASTSRLRSLGLTVRCRRGAFNPRRIRVLSQRSLRLCREI